jgi:hypothetical protein
MKMEISTKQIVTSITEHKHRTFYDDTSHLHFEPAQQWYVKPVRSNYTITGLYES